MHAHLKNEFVEDEKYHKLMRWLNCVVCHHFRLVRIKSYFAPCAGFIKTVFRDVNLSSAFTRTMFCLRPCYFVLSVLQAAPGRL